MVGLTETISKAFNDVRPTLRSVGVANNHRHISLGLLPPNRKNPLVRKYRKKARLHETDRGSFYSLDEDFGSVMGADPSMLDVTAEEEGVLDGGELSRTVSLPSTLASEAGPSSALNVDWILEEHERRYSTVNGSAEDIVAVDVEGAAPDMVHYTHFMHRVKQQLPSDKAEVRVLRPRKLSYYSIGSKGGPSSAFRGSEDLDDEPATVKSESLVLLCYSVPLIFTFLLEQMFPVVCALVVGHLGKNELAAVSLASMTTNITFAIFEGISTSLDTLCPQAYGARNYYGVGLHMQRCVLFSLAFFVPFAALFWFSEGILPYLIKEKSLVPLTSQFLRVMIVGGPGFILFENLKRYLQAQGIFDAGIYVLLICCPLNIVMSYLLVWNPVIGLGFIGAPIAVALNFWCMFLLLLLYCIYFNGSKCWGGLSRKAFDHWKDLSKLAVPGIIMLEAEDMSYEILTLFSSYLGTEYLAAQSAVSTTVAMLYMIPFAVGISVSTRIAQYIGARNPDNARLASRVGIASSAVVGIVNCTMLILGRDLIPRIYSSDAEVIRLMREILPLLGLVEIFDALNAIAGSCLRGQGMQYVGSVVNLVVYYLFAIPLGMLLSWTFDMKLSGLWVGIGSGMLVIGLIEGYYVLFADWDMLIDRAEMLKETEDDSDEEVDEFSALLP
ncbi:AEL099Wp [Eremothecium gossypii ATCC 10895]|uniref:AEL099Wp n=1 Tax=Eremothecium gossypii (strain ATCC 10895 / CBS 109.51 / FGSC 9923 / NRRL Y-1056) TaxID=284811 RepID=Q757W1_EREGS|nr:AEL099Wp [Eremothecium gossypii ATCC 10895]AAS52586.2 AEL099Wp [Eremothecium gossypii ATCC 10895]AEY96888.1 FAEL099Wp [Eremothecium gossypii FDAG1]